MSTRQMLDVRSMLIGGLLAVIVCMTVAANREGVAIGRYQISSNADFDVGRFFISVINTETGAYAIGASATETRRGTTTRKSPHTIEWKIFGRIPAQVR